MEGVNMGNQQTTPPGEIIPGLINVTFRSTTSLYEASELWESLDLKPKKDGITYNNNFPPAVIHCTLIVPKGQEAAYAEKIMKYSSTLVIQAQPVKRFFPSSGPYGC